MNVHLCGQRCTTTPKEQVIPFADRKIWQANHHATLEAIGQNTHNDSGNEVECTFCQCPLTKGLLQVFQFCSRHGFLCSFGSTSSLLTGINASYDCLKKNTFK